MPQAWVGLAVQVPVNPVDHDGETKTAATILRVSETEGPNGGVMVNVRVHPNSALAPYWLPGVELVDYEHIARDPLLGLGVGLGAWPLDG